MNLRIQMKNNNKKSILFSTLWLIVLSVLTGVGAAHAQTVTHKREIRLPVRLNNVPQIALNDSGLGATDLDQTQQVVWKQRFIAMHNRLYAMHEREDGTAYYGTVRQSDVESHLTSIIERHINTNSSYPTEATLFGMMGQGNRYNLINHTGQTLDRWWTDAPSSRAIVFGGAGTSILATGAPYLLNGVETRLISINHNTQAITSFSGDVVQQTGKSIGVLWMRLAYGADDLLYLFDYENLRILKFDTGVRGGTRGAFLGTFDLDPTKPAINSMTVDPAGNVYIGSDNGGFHIYGGDGQWKQSVEGVFQTDPNSFPIGNGVDQYYMNFYASGLNDGNGTLDVRDASGYRQYTITAPGQTPPVQITTQPQSQAICLLSPTSLSVSAQAGDGAALTYQWRKNGVDLTDGGTISGATTPNLNISSTVSGDAGYYDVLVRKPGAIVTSQAAIITVTPTPVITQQPNDQSLQIGDGATFTAAADNSPAMQWQVSTDGGKTFSDIDGATNATFSIPSVDNSHVGNYYRAVFAGLCGDPVISRAASLKLSQTITFANPGAKTFGDPAFDLGGTASSGLPVSYTVVFGPATVSGSVLTLTNSGIVSVRASQSGDADYAAAPDVTQTFTVMRPGNPAAPYVVDTISDDVALSACTSAPNDCSLRAAVVSANSLASDETIDFDSSLAGQTIVLNSINASYAGQLNIADNGLLTINGLGLNQLTISGNSASRVFFIEETAVAAINNLTVSGGKGDGGNFNGNGGGIYNLNGTLTLTNVNVSGNSAPNGGGIYSNGGALTLSRSTVGGNSTINSSGNGAGSGGGIFANNSTLTLTNSTVSSNRAVGATSGGAGGGIYVNNGTTALTNSTISDNRAGGGGGVYIASFNSGTTTLTNMTVTNNLNRGAGGPYIYCGGVYNAGTSTVNVSNSIIANNGISGGIFDVTGPFVSGGYNLIGTVWTSGTHRATGFGAAGDQFGTNGTRLDALLLPLGFYGGATETHALAAGSPAIDAGNGTSPIDQRGFSRPFNNLSVTDAPGGNGADIGAVEMQPADLTVAKNHSGDFSQGDTGNTYSITVTNSGGAATSGTVSVTDTLPLGLTATGISGTGWNCALDTLLCTRADSIGAGESFPAISLTVNVAADAPAEVTNIAGVSGGGETNTANNTASDPTTIDAAPKYSISGAVSYGITTAGQPDSMVANVRLTSAGTASFDVFTDSSGNYLLSNLPGGNYTVTPVKTDGIKGINSTDATRIQQHLVGMTTLTANQLIAADTDGNAVVNSFDATRIQQKLVGIQTSNIIGQWKFVPGSRQYDLGGNMSGQNYQAVLVGEVSGNWATAASFADDSAGNERKYILPETNNFVETEDRNQTAGRLEDTLSGRFAGKMKQSSEPVFGQSKTESLGISDIQVSLPTNAMSSTGNSVTIPISISQIPAGSAIESFDFSVFYNPAVLQPAAPAGSNAGTLSANCSVLSNSPVSGRVIVSGACAQAITTGSGVLYNLTFNVIGAANQTTSLSFTDPANNTNTFQFNNGTPTVSTTNGQFTVLAPTAANVSISGRVLTREGRGLINAVVLLIDLSGNTRTTRTNPFGYFRFYEVQAGQAYIFNVSRKGYTFAPQVVKVSEDLTELTFTAQQ